MFLQGIFHELINFHDCCFVAAPVAIVGCGEDSHDISLVGPIVAIHHQLMGSGDQLQVVGMVELLGDVLSEGVTGTSG
jgi:hypothetical protein